MQAGLLMESIQAQQRAVGAAVQRLTALADGLDSVVRQELRCAFAEEFAALGTASEQATQALLSVRRAASLRMACWSVGVSLILAALPLVLAWSLLPAGSELARLRAERDALSAAVQSLRASGGRIDLRRCGAGERLCVRIERSAPAYGAAADYVVVKGY